MELIQRCENDVVHSQDSEASSDVQMATFQPLPPRSLNLGHLDKLASIGNCNAREMIWFIRRLRKLYGDAKNQEERGASRHLLITEIIDERQYPGKTKRNIFHKQSFIAPWANKQLVVVLSSPLSPLDILSFFGLI